MKEKIRDFIHRLKIFGWYLLTEPIREIKQSYYGLKKFLGIFNKTLTWAWLTLPLMTLAFFKGMKLLGGLFILVLLFSILSWEWQRGYFIKRHRDKEKNRVLKGLKNETNHINDLKKIRR